VKAAPGFQPLPSAETPGISTITLDPSSSAEFTPETASRTPVLITAPEVAFSTAAAAVSVQPSATRWWIRAARDAVAAAVHRFLTTPTPRRRYLDDAVMARETYRL
jgi:hypothetical protein